MTWSWCEDEDRRLDYLDHAAQVLYLRVLRRRVDFDTGIVGVSCRLSYQAIAEWLEIRPEWGSNKSVERLSIGRIRALLLMLERAGLIERVTKNGRVLPLVFKLVFASTGLVRLKKERQTEQQENFKGTTDVCAADESAIDRLFFTEKSRRCGSFVGGGVALNKAQKLVRNNSVIFEDQQGEQHTTGSTVTSINNNISMRARGNGGLISSDWLPSVEIVKRIVNQFGLPPEFLLSKAIEYRILWRDSAAIAENWDWYFFGACRKRVLSRDGEFVTAIELKKQQ